MFYFHAIKQLFFCFCFQQFIKNLGQRSKETYVKNFSVPYLLYLLHSHLISFNSTDTIAFSKNFVIPAIRRFLPKKFQNMDDVAPGRAASHHIAMLKSSCEDHDPICDFDHKNFFQCLSHEMLLHFTGRF